MNLTFMFNKKVLVFLLVIIVAAGGWMGIKKTATKTDSTQRAASSPSQQNEIPRIISTKPDPLDENIVSSEEIIEITFNKTLQNAAEFRIRIEPEIEYKIELSGDRKTAKIIPAKPYPLGTTFTLFIGPETKFDGVGNWGEEKVFHFRTIKYTGV